MHLLTKTSNLKRLLFLLLSWYIFTNASETTDWWIELITDPITGTITKVKRSDYLEFKELIPIRETNLNKNWYTKGERIKSMYPDIKNPKTIPDYIIN